MLHEQRFVPKWKSPNQVWGPPGLVKIDTRVYRSDKQMGPEVNHLPPSSSKSMHVTIHPTLCLPGAHRDILYLLQLHNLFM